MPEDSPDRDATEHDPDDPTYTPAQVANDASKAVSGSPATDAGDDADPDHTD